MTRVPPPVARPLTLHRSGRHGRACRSCQTLTYSRFSPADQASRRGPPPKAALREQCTGTLRAPAEGNRQMRALLDSAIPVLSLRASLDRHGGLARARGPPPIAGAVPRPIGPNARDRQASASNPRTGQGTGSVSTGQVLLRQETRSDAQRVPCRDGHESPERPGW